jgi:hypothetical protein
MATPITPRGLFRAKIQRQIFDLQKLSKTLGETNGKTLSLVGRDIQEAAKRGIGQSAPARTKTGAKAVGADRLIEFDGGFYRDRTVKGGRPRPAGKPIKSWSPLRFSYRDVVYFLDAVRGTVVIGPYKAPWLHQLHEFGGTLVQTAYRVGAGTARRAALIRRKTGKAPVDDQGRMETGSIIWSHRGFRGSGRTFEKTGMTRQARFPPRPFMQGAAGVQRAMAKANRWFRDTFYPRRAA